MCPECSDLSSGARGPGSSLGGWGGGGGRAKFGLQSYKKAGSQCSQTGRGVAGAGGGVQRGRGAASGPQSGKTPFTLLSCPGNTCTELPPPEPAPARLCLNPPPTPIHSGPPPCLEARFKVSPRGLSTEIAVPISVPLALIQAFFSPLHFISSIPYNFLFFFSVSVCLQENMSSRRAGVLILLNVPRLVQS